MADEITGLGFSEEQLRKTVPVMTIGQMRKQIEERNKKRSTLVTNMSLISIESGYVMKVDQETGEQSNLYPFDESAIKAFGMYFGIPIPFLLKKLGAAPDVQAGLVDWFIRDSGDREVSFTSEDGALVELGESDQNRIELYDAACIIGEVLGVDTVVRRVEVGLNSTIFDVTRPDEIVSRHSDKDDVIEGGLRITLPHKKLAPEIGSYYHRLKCSNGAYSSHPGSSIRVKGHSKNDILEEMRERVETIWQNVPAMLNAYVSLDDVKVENVRYMVQVFADEHKLPDRAKDLAVKYVDEFLATDKGKTHEWTYFDILQLFTAIAHADVIKMNTELKLQAMAGHMVLNAMNEARCDSCKRLRLA